jgi:hypothetical protein
MSFFSNIFSNAVSFISVFFTKKDESDFDDLYLESEQPTGQQIGELVALVPEVPPETPPVTAGLVQVPEAPPEAPTGLVVVQPATEEAKEVMDVDLELDLLEVHKNSILIPLYTNPISKIIYTVTTKKDDTELKNTKSAFKSQVTTMTNIYYKDISKIEFCIEIVNQDDAVNYDYILDMNDGTKLGFINLKMYNAKEPTPFMKDDTKAQNYVTVTNNKTINFADSDMVNNIKNALETLDNYITQKKTFKNTDIDNWKKIFFNKDELYTQRSKVTYQNYYNQNMTKSATDPKISPNVNLVMSYYYNPYTLNNYGISFSYVIAPVKTQKKTLLTQEMINIISDKLNISTCVKGLFESFGNLPNENKFVLILDNLVYNQAVIEIYNNPILSDKLTQLKSKPYTLLASNSLNTYLNILISMLDKPHDIIGKRVPEEIQKYMLNNVIAPNIEKYIKYLGKILGSVSGSADKINEFNNFIEFVKQMVFTFTNNASKHVNSETSYENAIMLFVCKILESSNITTGNNFLTELNNKFKINELTSNNIVINPDIMYLTTDITDRVNQPNPNSKIRRYFSSPEVIDHGHVYEINNNTNIQFPENYKEIQLKDVVNNGTYFTIHSYSETTNYTGTDGVTNLYYNVYVWFTQSTEPTLPKCLIKYSIPFMKAPDCAGVYSGYKNNIDYDKVKPIFTNIANNFTGLSPEMKELIPFLMLDQFYNAKSLQDDQNQLQVNQITTIAPVPPTTSNSVPTQFLGLCCDLTSAANGFNYYMSRQLISDSQNTDSIVGYYHSNKKIWITNKNLIKFEINTAKKDASKDIFNVLINILTTTAHIGGVKRFAEVDYNYSTKKIRQDNVNIENNTETYIYYNTMENWVNDNHKIEEYGQYVYYNTMADWLYADDNFKKYDLNLLFKQVEYEVNNKKYLSSNCFFDIFSNDFVKKMIEMLEIYSKQPNIQTSNLNDIIGKCAIYILTKFKLTPDNIVTPDEQIKISNNLDTAYFQIKRQIETHTTNTGEGTGTNFEFSGKVFERTGSPTGIDELNMSQNDYWGGKLFKKTTKRKLTKRKLTKRKLTKRKLTKRKLTKRKLTKRKLTKK